MNSQTQKGEITLVDLIRKSVVVTKYLFSKKIIIIAVAFLAAVAGFLLALADKPVYSASLSFTVDEQKSNSFSGALGLASQLGFDLGGDGSLFSGENLNRLFTSRKMVEKTLLQPSSAQIAQRSFAQRYMEIYELKPKPPTANIQLPTLADRSTFSRQQDSMLGIISNSIVTNDLKIDQADKKVDIITINMKSVDEDFAKNFTETLARSVSEFYVETKIKKSQANMEILQRQTDSVRRELNGAISGAAAATDNVFGLNPALNIKRVPTQKKEVDIQANTAMLMELVKQNELAKIMLRKETPLIQVIDRPVLPLKKEKMGKLKSAIIGGFLGGFACIFILLLIKLIVKIKKLEQNSGAANAD